MAAGIAYVDGPRFARAMTAAADWVAAGREDLDRINVFPVPDGDTGTNLYLTLRAVADAVRQPDQVPLGAAADTAARAAVLGARGNSGMLLAHFLLGLADSWRRADRVTGPDLARALRAGSDRLQASLDEPREGTILTVAREVAREGESAREEAADLSRLLPRLLAAGQVALDHTPDQMPVLKAAGVVDAGAKGFVRMIEGIVRLIRGEPIAPAPSGPVPEAAPAGTALVAPEQDFQFCTEATIRAAGFPPLAQVRAALRRFGGSVQAAIAGDVLKLHVHTDTPEAVFTYVAAWGEVAATKAEDMRAQHRRMGGAQRPVAVLTDSACDLPESLVERHGIRIVPLQIVWGDRVYRDRVELSSEAFNRELRTNPVLPTTSQPTPADFIAAFREARGHADEAIAVLLGSRLSGTYQSGVAAARAGQITGIRLVDGTSASLGEGLLVLRAAELAESGWPAERIAAELSRLRGQSGILLTVDRLDNLLRSGRVSRSRAWLAGLLDLKPILALDADGAVVPVERVRGRERVRQRVLELLDARLTPRPRALRLGVAHVDEPELAASLRDELISRYHPRDCLVSPATGVLATHVGPGAWALAWLIEDEEAAPTAGKQPGGDR